MGKLLKSWPGKQVSFALLALIAACLLVFRTSPSTSAPDPGALKVQGADTLGNIVNTWILPPGAGGTTITMLAQSSANAAATNNVSLAAAANQTTYVTGFQISGGGATAGSVVNCTLTGVVVQTQNYQFGVATGAAVGDTPLVVQFVPPLAASGQNQAITLNVPSFGAGNTNAAAAIQGFRQ